MTPCTVSDCPRRVHAKGLCHRHYVTKLRNGDPTIRLRRPWGTGTTSKNGYRLITVGGKQVLEHRVLWERANGPIPPGYTIHHKNHQRADNRLENLEALPCGEHTKLHHPKTQKPCMADGCGKPPKARSLCSKHYQCWYTAKRRTKT